MREEVASRGRAAVENVAALAALTAVAAAWIDLSQVAHYLEILGTDVFHNTWTWNALLANIAHLRSPLDPSIFYPDRFSSLYGDLQLGNALIYAVPKLLTKSDAVGYATVLVLADILTGFFAYKIARLLGATCAAAAFAAIVAGFMPYRFAHLVHVQVLTVFWALAPIYFAIKYQRFGRALDLVWLTALLIQLLFGPSYNLVAFIVVASVILPWQAWALRRDAVGLRRLMLICAAGLIAMLATSWIWYQAYELYLAGAGRDAQHNAGYRADLAWLFVPPVNGMLVYGNLYQRYLEMRTGLPPHYAMFPGIVAIGTGMIVLHRLGRLPLEAKALLLAAGLLLALSLGDLITWNGLFVAPNPVFQLVTMTPLLAASRQLGHFGSIAITFAAIVVACSIPRRWPRIVVVLLVVALAVETYAPMPTERVAHIEAPEMPLVHKFLDTLPARSAAVFLPLPLEASHGDKTFARQYDYMRYARHHQLRLVNGISGLFPPTYHDAMKAFRSVPSQAASDWIAKYHVRYVILDREAPGAERVKDVEHTPGLHKIWDRDGYAVFEVR